MQPGYPWYELLYMLGIIFFAYFYISIVMKPDDIADNFRKSGSFIPGIRPGKRTSDFINDILTRITLVGALYLIVISLVPTFLISGIRFDKIWLIGRFFENLPDLGDAWLGGQLLLWRHFAADCGGCGHGHRQPDRIAADHASL